MTFIHFDESITLINELEIKKYKTEKLYLCDTQNYILAEDIITDHNSPEYPTSAMDGYAFAHKDIHLGELLISSINPAGSSLNDKIEDGKCIKTFTGSLMPEGSDTLIPIENVTVDNNKIIINKPVPKGFSVRAIGENYSKNEKLIPKNTKINFPEIGVMASLNIVSPLIYRKPTVSILSTGSELLELGQTQTNDAQIRSSNNYILEAIVKKYDGIPVQLGCIKDDKESITDAISNALEQSDIVVTTGGVSVGDFDFVKDIIYELNCELVFKGVRVKPGQHIILARKDDKFIIGLPGFAYSSTVTALLYLVPLISKLQNSQSPMKIVKAKLKEPFIKRTKKAEFTACNYILIHGKYEIDFNGKKVGSSAILTNMLGSIALLVTTEDDNSKDIGEEVNIIILD